MFSKGIYCTEIDNNYNYLFIGSYSDNNNKKTTTKANRGISLWRFINSKPYIENVFLTETINEMVN